MPCIDDHPLIHLVDFPESQDGLTKREETFRRRLCEVACELTSYLRKPVHVKYKDQGDGIIHLEFTNTADLQRLEEVSILPVTFRWRGYWPRYKIDGGNYYYSELLERA